MSEIKHESTTTHIKHKGYSGLRNFRSFNKLRQIYDLTVNNKSLICVKRKFGYVQNRQDILSKPLRFHMPTLALADERPYNIESAEKQNKTIPKTQSKSVPACPTVIPFLSHTYYFCQRTSILT